MRKIALLIALFLSVSLAHGFPELSIDFNFVPNEIYPTESTIGVFNIVNPQGARPVFDLDITMWAPCNDGTYHDWETITDWDINSPSWKDTRVIFSGIQDRRLAHSSGEIGGIPFDITYAQCKYSFVFQLPSHADGFKGPAVIRPGESINLNFTLWSTASAGFGSYDMGFDSDHIHPGKELAQIVSR